MAPEQSRRRRVRRRGDAPAAARVEEAPGLSLDWVTFPVIFAFCAGALVMAVLINTEPAAYVVFLVLSIFGTAFCVAHLAGRRLRQRRKQ